MSGHHDPRVDAYIESAAEFARPILSRLRADIHRACPDVTETMKWSRPFFEHCGVLCAMAAFKAHCAFMFWHSGMNEVVDAPGAEVSDAMGHFGRITSLRDLPDEKTLARYIKAAVRLNESGTPARTRPKPQRRPDVAVPADLAAALRKNKKASATFASFSPSHRREYIEWITEAKRDETRAKRLATTLEWLAEGKPRNWKYASC